MVFVTFMGEHALGLFGLVYIVTAAVKMARGYAPYRWFW